MRRASFEERYPRLCASLRDMGIDFRETSHDTIGWEDDDGDMVRITQDPLDDAHVETRAWLTPPEVIASVAAKHGPRKTYHQGETPECFWLIHCRSCGFEFAYSDLTSGSPLPTIRHCPHCGQADDAMVRHIVWQRDATQGAK